MRGGLPVLQRMIGVDYPGHEPRALTVEEAANSRLGEYAGIFDPDISQIQIRYDADAVVTLHEAAHIWFNGTLFKDRWIGEALAEYYAAKAAARLHARGGTPALTDGLLQSKVALNDWGEVGVESLDVEDYAYAATYEVARAIARRTDSPICGWCGRRPTPTRSRICRSTTKRRHSARWLSTWRTGSGCWTCWRSAPASATPTCGGAGS